jgi:hypothetical protein
VDLLLRALAMNPANRQIADRLGNEYAVILASGIEVDASGRMTRFDPSEASSDLARNVRAELENSTQAAMLYATGYVLTNFYADAKKAGWELAGVDTFSIQLLERAKAIEPNIAPQRIRVGGNVQAANLVKKVTQLPTAGCPSPYSGRCEIRRDHCEDGSIQNVQVVGGHPF